MSTGLLETTFKGKCHRDNTRQCYASAKGEKCVDVDSDHSELATRLALRQRRGVVNPIWCKAELSLLCNDSEPLKSLGNKR